MNELEEPCVEILRYRLIQKSKYNEIADSASTFDSSLRCLYEEVRNHDNEFEKKYYIIW